MTTSQIRSEAEFMSHAWSAGSSKDLDYTLSFDTERELLIVTGASAQQDDDYKVAANAFGRAAVALLTQLEDCALRLCIHGRCIETNPDRNADWDMHILEEARHFGALQRYYHGRWADSLPYCENLERWLGQACRASRLKNVSSALGFIESAAKSLALMLHSNACDPLLVRMCSFILADEQFHNESEPVGREWSVPAKSIIDVLDVAACSAGRADAHLHLMRLFVSFAAEWLPLELLHRSVGSQEIGWEGAAARSRELAKVAALNAHEYLSRLRDQVDPTPPPGLAIEWLVAGLRGRSEQPVSRRRWVDLEAE